jgi:predicted nuclease of predicted toxin-antitoxin system
VAERIKYLFDEHVPAAVTSGLRSRGVDVLTAQESVVRAATDEDVLALATTQGRVIFTQDADFLRLHAAGRTHAGIVYAHQQTQIGDIVRGRVLIYQVLEPRDMRDHVEFV